MTEASVFLVLMTYGLVCLAALLGLVAFGWVAGYGAGYQHGLRGRKDGKKRPRFLDALRSKVSAKGGDDDRV